VLHEFGQQVGPDRVDDAQPQRAIERVLAAFGDLPDRLCLLDHGLRLSHDGLAQGCRADLIAAAFEDLHVEFVLQLLDRHGKRRLRNETSLGRAPEVALAGYGHDVAELGERHGRVVEPVMR
jgi:hypothetical protein